MAALAVLIVSIGLGSFSSAQDVPCAVPEPLARTNGATWPKGTNVTVIINPTAFPTNEQRDAIKAAFDTWQNANTNSGVTFTVTTGTQPRKVKKSTLIILLGEPLQRAATPTLATLAHLVQPETKRSLQSQS
jgi:hypothetical protein